MKKFIIAGIIAVGIIIGIGIIGSLAISDKSLNLGDFPDHTQEQNEPISKPPGRDLSIELGENLGFSTP